MAYQYNCVISSHGYEIGKKQKHSDIAVMYADYLTKQSEAGWEFIAIDEVTSNRPAGCLARLFGRKFERKLVKILIFRKEI